MSVRSRVAFASGAGAVVGALLLLSGRYEGSVVLVALVVLTIRTAALGALVGAGPIVAAEATRALRARALLAPAWALAAAAAIARTGSTAILDVRGANAVVGPALLYGPVLTVVGSWFAFGAAAFALAASRPIGASTAAADGSVGRIVPPATIDRLGALGVVAEAALLVTLFIGPQAVEGVDAVWWVGGIAALSAGAWIARRKLPQFPLGLPAATSVAGIAGLILVLIGGRP